MRRSSLLRFLASLGFGASMTLPATAEAASFSASTTTKLGDPVYAYSRLGALFSTVFEIILLAGAVTAFIFLIVGGIQYGTAGDGQGAVKGRQTIMYAVIGLCLLASVYVFIMIYNGILPDAP